MSNYKKPGHATNGRQVFAAVQSEARRELSAKSACPCQVETAASVLMRGHQERRRWRHQPSRGQCQVEFLPQEGKSGFFVDFSANAQEF